MLPSLWAPQAKKTPGLIFVFLKKKKKRCIYCKNFESAPEKDLKTIDLRLSHFSGMKEVTGVTGSDPLCLADLVNDAIQAWSLPWPPPPLMASRALQQIKNLRRCPG